MVDKLSQAQRKSGGRASIWTRAQALVTRSCYILRTKKRTKPNQNNT